MDAYLRVSEVAEVLRTTESAIRKRIWRKQIESIRTGKIVLVRRSAIETYCRKHTRRVIREVAPG